MPDRPSLDDGHLSTLEPTQSQKSSLWDRLLTSKLGHRQKREDTVEHQQALSGIGQNGGNSCEKAVRDLKPSRIVIPELPRSTTFRRQDSEKRDRLSPHTPCVAERRALSTSRKRASSALRLRRTRSPAQPDGVHRSAPVLPSSIDGIFMNPMQQCTSALPIGNEDRSTQDHPINETEDEVSVPRTAPHNEVFSDVESITDPLNDPEFREELERRWILNLSMHFRDRSEREKFIVTFAEQPTKWRRVTVSCDYRDAEPGSLEANLKELGYQRDKNAYIYDAIRESLADIKFYDTVTNLKLETKDRRLHVHVTEDMNEIVSYPSLSAIEHLNLRSEDRFSESSICFEAHQSGFVYKVSIHDRYFIKKEIPSPDTVEEFLYEINALTALRSSNHVIRFCGIVVDDDNRLIKGILINYAKQGALVDLIFDHDKVPLPWSRREKWAKQIIEGLQDIHEYGFVQGDLTLSNIVIDANDDAKIIDINRRGCPVGWEPPEFIGLITSGQRVSMYIGIKSDLFQLGMVLWGLAMLCDEPEREEGPLSLGPHNCNVPEYFCELVNSCLSDNPAHRMSARELLLRFPRDAGISAQEGSQLVLKDMTQNPPRTSRKTNPSDESMDVEEHRRLHPGHAWGSTSQRDMEAVDGSPAQLGIDISITAAGSHLELQGVDGDGQRDSIPDVLVLEDPPSLSLDDSNVRAPLGLPFLNRDPLGMDCGLPSSFGPEHAKIFQSSTAKESAECSGAGIQQGVSSHASNKLQAYAQADKNHHRPDESAGRNAGCEGEITISKAQSQQLEMHEKTGQQDRTETFTESVPKHAGASTAPEHKSQEILPLDESPARSQHVHTADHATHSQETRYSAWRPFTAPIHQDSGFQDEVIADQDVSQNWTKHSSLQVDNFEEGSEPKQRIHNDIRLLTDQKP